MKTNPSAAELLREMRSSVMPVDSSDQVRGRRERIVQHLKEAQVTVRFEQTASRGRLRRMVVAAAVVVPALAACMVVYAMRGGADTRSKTEAAVTENPSRISVAARIAPTPVGDTARAAVKQTDPVDAPGPDAPSAKSAFAGEPSQGASPARTAAEKPRKSGAFASAVAGGVSGGRTEASFPPERPSSTLSEENALMERAMMASRSGDDRRAVATLDTLLARYPRSILRENARMERFRALRRLGDVTEASREAQHYLAEHPDGAGRDEARKVAVESTSRRSAP